MSLTKNCPTCKQTYDQTQSFCPRDGEVLQESHDELVGQVLDGKYVVEEFLAQGGMGAVYRARHILLGDRVVIKTLKSEMRGNAEWLRRFQREGRAARAFRHPNAVTVYDLSTASDGRLIYMVMEFVEGTTLSEELRAYGAFEPELVVAILSPVANVLDAAHARGVVHRDLKPENVMLGVADDGSRFVKVLDLGIAKMLGADVQSGEATSLTVAGQLLGTPYYMSPEQWGELARDGRAEIDGRADIYSLAVIAFELLTGRRPLDGQTIPELRQAHVTAPPPSVRSFAPSVPIEFDLAVSRAMSKDRNDRPTTAGEFISELRAALQHAAERTPTLPLTDDASDANRIVDNRRGGETDAGNALGARPTSAPAQAAETIIQDGREEFAGRGDTSAQTREPSTGAVNLWISTESDGGADALPMTSSEDKHRQVETRSQRQSGEARKSQASAVAATSQTRGSGKLLIAGAAVFALLIVTALGALLAWNQFGAAAETEKNEATARTGADVGETNRVAEPPVAAVPPAAAKVESLAYWVESFGVSGTEAPKRLAEESLTLSSGEYFQFHFVARERGYLYIVGPGDGNAPTLFLGAQGGGALKTNQLAAGANFAFPFGESGALRLDRNAGTEDYTVIFSPVPLTEPAALSKKVPYTLKPDELKAIEELRLRQKSSSPELSVGDVADGRRVNVLVPQTRDATLPVVFDIRIEHR